MATGYVTNQTTVYYGPGSTNYPSSGSYVGPNESVEIMWREGSWFYIEYQAGSYRKRMYILASAVSNVTGSYSFYSPTRSTRYVGRGASTYNGPSSATYATAGSVGNYEQVTLFTEKIENEYALIEYDVSGGQKKRAWFPFGNLGVAKGLDTGAAISSQSMAYAIRDAGYSFVGRYYRPDVNNGLSQTELNYLHNAGLSVFPYYQYKNNSAEFFTYAEGVSAANSAYAKALSLGQPSGTNIYFAVDFDATPSQVSGCVTSYFNGVVSRMEELGDINGRVYNVGVYGGTRVCEGLTVSDVTSRTLACAWNYNPSYYGWTNFQYASQGGGTYETIISGVQFDVVISKSPHGGGWTP